MRVEQLGEGDPEIAVVGGIHGDEPCGVYAVERLIAADLDVRRPVRLIVANEPAVERGVRFVDADLNRSFPGEPGADTYERRLASELASAVGDCTTLALHSTQSYAAPFAVTDGVDEFARELCPQLPVDVLVDTGSYVDGRLFAAAETVEVECGLQGSEAAADNATRIARAFLTALGALPGETDRRELPTFRLTRPIAKPPADEYEVFAENFSRVAAGEAFAAADGERLVADDVFYPVLLSAYGYTDIFGYASHALGPLVAP